MLHVAILYILAATVLGFLLSLFLSNNLLKPILNLVKQVQAYESGKIQSRDLETVLSTDEVGILKHAISRLISTIQLQTYEREKSYQRTLHAERKAAESERMAEIGQLSAGLAHELNNPLTVILGAARMAADTDRKGSNKWLDEIHIEAERCRRLVSELLDFAKPIRLSLRRADLGCLAKETWNRLSPNQPPYQLEMNHQNFMATVDKDRFQQVFFNLFRNAMEAMPQGGKVRVSFSKKRNHAQVQISDQGTGISQKHRSQLFRPFFTTKPRGTGLGLTIVRSILQAHHGKILISLNRPKGITITLDWPQG
jgi:signal transduction histidine kinase